MNKTQMIGDLIFLRLQRKLKSILLRFSHILKEGSGVPCEDCGIIYQNFFYLRIHKRQAHEEISCKECNEIFIGDNELGRHRRKVHLKGNEHICEVCGQGFKMKFYMKRHKRSVESFLLIFASRFWYFDKGEQDSQIWMPDI